MVYGMASAGFFNARPSGDCGYRRPTKGREVGVLLLLLLLLSPQRLLGQAGWCGVVPDARSSLSGGWWWWWWWQSIGTEVEVYAWTM